MNEAQLTTLATILLVVVGAAQIMVLIAQERQTRISLTILYRQLWTDGKTHWGNVLFLGREEGAYYQVLDETHINGLKEKTKHSKLDTPTMWALESIQNLCGLLGEISTRILQGHLNVSDVYPILGTDFLRHSRPLRQILDPDYPNFNFKEATNSPHTRIRREIQDWVNYHDGLRRRCLILIDLLWAEASRLEDLPPDDMKRAAEVKKMTGKLNKKRVFQETYRLNGLTKLLLALRLSFFLKRSEYYSFFNPIGISEKRLSLLDATWTNRLLRNHWIK